MAEPLTDQVIQMIDQAAELYHRLLLVVAPVGAGKTRALHEVHERAGAPLININLEISLRMLECSARTRPARTTELIDSTMSAITHRTMTRDLHEQQQSYTVTT
jgi:type II secretory pathway predicted ATPase ExeA